MYTWYKLFNCADLDAKNVPYLEDSFELDKMGVKTIRLYKGQFYSLLVDGVFLPVHLNGRNPFKTSDGKLAAFMDKANNIWVGYAG